LGAIATGWAKSKSEVINMALTCVLLKTTEDGQEPVCRLSLQGDRIVGEAIGSGNDMLLRNVLAEDPLRVAGKAIPQTNAEAWLRALPWYYTGSYLRAQLLDDSGRESNPDEPKEERGRGPRR
jgi:hypothetical protein